MQNNRGCDELYIVDVILTIQQFSLFNYCMHGTQNIQHKKSIVTWVGCEYTNNIAHNNSILI